MSKEFYTKIRHPLPKKTGGPHSTKKGRHGYSRLTAAEAKELWSKLEERDTKVFCSICHKEFLLRQTEALDGNFRICKACKKEEKCNGK